MRCCSIASSLLFIVGSAAGQDDSPRGSTSRQSTDSLSSTQITSGTDQVALDGTGLLVPANDSRVSYTNGRFFHTVSSTGASETRFDWINSQISLTFTASASLAVTLSSHGVFNVSIDDSTPFALTCNGSARYALASGLDTSAVHNVSLTLRTEAKVSNRTTPLAETPSKFRGFALDSGAVVSPTIRTFSGKLVVVGDSITAGWGNTAICCGKPAARSEPCAEDGTQSYGSMVGRALGLETQVIASGGSGFGTGGKNIGNKTGVDWTEFAMETLLFRELQFDASAGLTNLSAFVPDYLVMDVGTNDAGMIGSNPAAWEAIYVGVLQKLRAAWPHARFMLGCAPWTSYATQIQTVITNFGDSANRTVHLDWGDFKAVARGCFNHPSIAGHVTMAAKVASAIEALPK